MLLEMPNVDSLILDTLYIQPCTKLVNKYLKKFSKHKKVHRTVIVSFASPQPNFYETIYQSIHWARTLSNGPRFFWKNPIFHEYLSRYQPFPLKPTLETAPGPNILFPVDLPRPPTQPWPALLTPSRLKASRRVLRPWCMVAVYLHADGLRPFFSFFLRALAALGKPRLFTGSRAGGPRGRIRLPLFTRDSVKAEEYIWMINGRIKGFELSTPWEGFWILISQISVPVPYSLGTILPEYTVNDYCITN